MFAPFGGVLNYLRAYLTQSLMIPGSVAVPIVLCDFPVPDIPYAKMVPLKPSRTLLTMGLATLL